MNMVFLLVLSVLAGDGFEYVGSHRCIACHKKPERGDQAGAWRETAHADAMETLHTEQARIWAKERGLKKPPHQEPGCVKCHSVGFSEGGYQLMDQAFWNPKEGDRKAAKAVKRMEHLKNVGCESCHGPGSGYKTRKKMEAIFKGEVDGESLGMKPVTKDTCLSCHNAASPAHKEPFDVEAAWKKISHTYPAGFREKGLEK